MLNKEKERLLRDLGGIREMPGMPDVMFVIDTKNEENAISEAVRLNIPVVGIVDTNCDPNKVEFAIPANDDATKSIAIVTNYIVAAIAEGLAERQAEKAEETDDADDSGTDAIKFDMGNDEEKDRRRGGPAGGKGRGPAGPQKRRVAGPGAGGNRPGGPGGRR